MIFFDQFKVPTIKFGKCFAEFMIPIASLRSLAVKDLYSTAPKRGSVFIGLMTPDGAILSRYQRTVFMR